MGYALFTPSYLANLHDRLRIYPVKAGLNDHCGMFFLDKDKKLICDDLTIRPYTLKRYALFVTYCKLMLF